MTIIGTPQADPTGTPGTDRYGARPAWPPGFTPPAEVMDTPSPQQLGIKYVAIVSPLLEDPAGAMRMASLAADALMAHGFICYIPALTIFQHMVSPHPPGDWIAQIGGWLEVCNAGVRVLDDKPSQAADAMMAMLAQQQKPVWPNMAKMLEDLGFGGNANFSG